MTSAPVTIWTRGQEILLKSRLSHWSDAENILYSRVPEDASSPTLDSVLGDSEYRECFINISLQHSSLFCRVQYLGKDKGGLRFATPETVFKVQRRQHQRVPIHDAMGLQVEYNDPMSPGQWISRKVVDLSRGGLSFFASAEEAAGIQLGQRWKNVALSVDGRKITVNTEVRHKKAMTGAAQTAGFKIGLSFSGISVSDADHIADYVEGETRKYFSKLF